MNTNIFDQILNDMPAANPVPLTTSTATVTPMLVKNERPVYPMDPRPDLTADSKWWAQLLAAAQDMDLELYGILHGFRCMGTRLVLLPDMTFRMRPMTLEDKTGKDCWINQESYRAAAIKWLGPANSPNKYGQMLKELLDKMTLFKKDAKDTAA